MGYFMRFLYYLLGWKESKTVFVNMYELKIDFDQYGLEEGVGMMMQSMQFSATSRNINPCHECIQENSGYLVYAALAVAMAIGMICVVRVVANKLKLSFKMTWIAFGSMFYAGCGYYLVQLDAVTAIHMMCIWVPWSAPFLALLMYFHHRWNCRKRRMKYMSEIKSYIVILVKLRNMP